MPHIYLTQSRLQKIINDPSIVTWDGQISYTIIPNRKTLTCSICGTQTKGRQWHNRDKGFGICQSCLKEVHAKGLSNGDNMQELLEELRQNYGIYGVHYGKLEDFILQS